MPYRGDCPHCGRSFRRLEHLQRHVRTHTKEKPFHCFCGRSFTRNDLLKRHNLRDHGDTEVGPQVPSESVPIPPAPPAWDETTNVDVDRRFREPSDARNTETNGQLTSADQSMGGLVSHGISSEAYFFPDVFDEFTTFVDSAGLEPTWEGMDFGATNSALLPIELLDTGLLKQQGSKPEEAIEDGDSFAEMIPFREELTHLATCPQTYRVSESERATLACSVADALPISHMFQLPSKQALTRYWQSYADGFHKHYPVLHLPTFSIGSSLPELSLIVAAIGAQYRFEFNNGIDLYHRAKEITWDRLSQCQHHTSLSRAAVSRSSCECGHPNSICTIVLLMAFSSWMQDPAMHSDSLRLQAPLAHALNQDGGLDELQTSDGVDDWSSWIYKEYRRRAKLIGFAYLDVQNLIYDTPPLVFGNTIHLLLPCSALEWAAATAADWQRLRVHHVPPVSFQEVFRGLLLNPPGVGSTRISLETSPLSLFILLQALLQRIYVAQRSKIPGSTALRGCDIEHLESALHWWKDAWRQDPGSTLDPQNVDGPIPFTSIAFLALASVRLHLDLGEHRYLESCDPLVMAASLHKVRRPTRGPDLATALLHSVHALSLPVRMGVDYVSRSQMFFWSCQHSICALECGIFVWKWLQEVEATADQTEINAAENKIISWIHALVAEALESLDPSIIDLSSRDVAYLTPSRLGKAVLQIWSRTLSGNSLWPMIRQISETFHILATRDESMLT